MKEHRVRVFEEDIFTWEGGGAMVYVKARGLELEYSQCNFFKKLHSRVCTPSMIACFFDSFVSY